MKAVDFGCSLLYKKRCSNKTWIKEKDLNEIIKNEIIKKLNISEITDKLKYYFEENNENIQKIKESKNQIDKLERKKRDLYKKKCDEYITLEKFKIEYERVKKEIEKNKNLIKTIEQNDTGESKEKKIKNIIQEFQNKKYMSNKLLKEIINKIEVYPENRIEIILNFD